MESPKVPMGWELHPLKRLISVASGSDVLDEVQESDSAIPVYGSGKGTFKYTSHNFSDSAAIIFGRKGSLGQPYIAKPPFWIVDTAYAATPTERSDFGFVYYSLLNFPWDPYITKTAKPSLVATEILGAKVAAPGVAEQRKVAAFLDAKTAEIDDVVEKLQAQRELLERYKRELIAHTVTKGLDTNAPMKDSGIDWIGKIPNSWHSRSLKSLLTRKSRKGEPSWRVLSVERERGVVDRELEGSPDNNNRLPDDLSGYLVVRNGQFVMNKMKAWQGSYGVSLYDGIVSPAYYTFDLASSVDSEFFNWAIRSKAYIPFFGRDSYGIRTDQWDFKVQALRNIPLFVPPVEEQRQIVDYLVQRLKGIDGLITDLDRQVELLGRYRKQVINDVVTGKIRVSEEA